MVRPNMVLPIMACPKSTLTLTEVPKFICAGVIFRSKRGHSGTMRYEAFPFRQLSMDLSWLQSQLV